MAEDTQTLHFLDYWRVIRDRKDIILAVALLTIVTGTIYTVMMPQKFRAPDALEVQDADDLEEDPARADDLLLREEEEGRSSARAGSSSRSSAS